MTVQVYERKPTDYLNDYIQDVISIPECNV